VDWPFTTRKCFRKAIQGSLLYGNDSPEAYALAKEGKMYYAFLLHRRKNGRVKSNCAD